VQRIAAATEDQVVLAFLRAEQYSSRYGQAVRDAIAGRPELLAEPNLSNESENELRRQALAYRGYGQNVALFAGFPADVSWSSVRLPREEVQELLLGFGIWPDLTGESRVLRVVAEKLRQPAMSTDERVGIVRSIAELDRAGSQFEPLVFVGAAARLCVATCGCLHPAADVPQLT
jgi:hypothetical protein